MTHNTDIIEQFHVILAPLMPEDGKLALLDFPDHANVGDSAIWLGEIAYLKQWHQITPRYVSSLQTFSAEAMEQAVGRAPIFLHGGGNFGDLWPRHQVFRELIVQRYPDRPIIQLPQSIHFNEGVNVAKAASVINAHPDFTLLVRDKQSYDIAKEAFTCRVELCPDMAFSLGAQHSRIHSRYPLLLLLRTDYESQTPAPTASQLPPGAVVEDWLEERFSIYDRIRRRLPPPGFNALNYNARRELRYRRLAENRLVRGLRQLSSAQYIITDRLHAHILSILLNIPHVTLDDNYGKIRRFDETWTNGLTLSDAVESLDEAIVYYKDHCAAA